MQIGVVILELLRMFYFQNIYNITGSIIEICMTCILFDRKLNFEFSQTNNFEILLSNLRKKIRFVILNSKHLLNE